MTMTDYLGSQAWRDELIDLLRTSATPPSRAIIIGKDQGLTDEQIAERWRELGGRRVKRCSVVNVWRRWQERPDQPGAIAHPDRKVRDAPAV